VAIGQTLGDKFLTGTGLEDAFYDILAGAGRATCLFAAMDLGLDRALAQGPLTEAEIVERLQLDRHRGHKWLVLLETVGLIESARDPGSGEVRYANAALMATLAIPQYSYFYREFMRFWRTAAMHEMSGVVRGAPVPVTVQYPPQVDSEVALLHDWMREGALVTLDVIERSYDFSQVRRILDVGGGDATIACALVKRHPALHSTVFNLPKAAALGRANVAAQGLGERVEIFVGDFFKDPLPQRGFDLVMFSRVLADWSPEVCRMLLTKAHAALAPDGWLLVAEPFRDQNPDLSIAWEHSYLPYDDFGAYVYKTTDSYKELFTEAGFSDIHEFPRDDRSIHGVLTARRR
jgi:SAM-dependent methyltransferase